MSKKDLIAEALEILRLMEGHGQPSKQRLANKMVRDQRDFVNRANAAAASVDSAAELVQQLLASPALEGNHKNAITKYSESLDEIAEGIEDITELYQTAEEIQEDGPRRRGSGGSLHGAGAHDTGDDDDEDDKEEERLAIDKEQIAKQLGRQLEASMVKAWKKKGYRILVLADGDQIEDDVGNLLDLYDVEKK